MREDTRHKLLLVTFLMALLLGISGTALGQSTATLQGTVSDAKGAVIPNATITVRNQATSVERTTQTDGEGNYQILQVPAGTYRIEFEKTGFQRSVDNKGIALSAGQSLRINGNLKVGSLTETVQVDAKVAQVDTATANVGATVYGTQVQELALTTRSFTQLVTLQPGVASNQAQQPGFGSNTSVGGMLSGGTKCAQSSTCFWHFRQ